MCTLLKNRIYHQRNSIRKRLIACSPIAENPQIGAISFIQHFGNTLNYHPHFHIIFADGIFSYEDGLQFYEAALTQDDITDTQEAIQKRVLRYFCNRKFFDKDEMEKMLTYENFGFSLDASVKIPAFDVDALECLIRYCARPPFKSENIRFNGPWINYRLPKPWYGKRGRIKGAGYCDSCDLHIRIARIAVSGPFQQVKKRLQRSPDPFEELLDFGIL